MTTEWNVPSLISFRYNAKTSSMQMPPCRLYNLCVLCTLCGRALMLLSPRTRATVRCCLHGSRFPSAVNSSKNEKRQCYAVQRKGTGTTREEAQRIYPVSFQSKGTQNIGIVLMQKSVFFRYANQCPSDRFCLFCSAIFAAKYG